MQWRDYIFPRIATFSLTVDLLFFSNSPSRPRRHDVTIGLCPRPLRRPNRHLVQHRARGVPRQRKEGEASEKSREHAQICQAGEDQPQEDDEKGCVSASPAGGERIPCQVLHDYSPPGSQGGEISLLNFRYKEQTSAWEALGHFGLEKDMVSVTCGLIQYLFSKWRYSQLSCGSSGRLVDLTCTFCLLIVSTR